MNVQPWIGSVFALVLATTLVGCNEQEQDDLAKAQACLDKVPQSNPTAADECLQYVANYDSQQANILKCSIYTTSGGLVENKVVNAYKALKDDTESNKTAVYMAYLALNLPDVDSAYTKAELADRYCQASGVPGMMYLSKIILSGTTFNYAIKNLPSGAGSGTGIDFNDPAAASAAVQNLLNECTGLTPPASCTNSLNTLGGATVALANQYCSNANADQNVCASINGAVDAAGGDPNQVGQSLFCYLKNLHYNSTTGQCQ